MPDEEKGSFKISRGEGALVSDRRIYETRDGRVVEEGDPEAFTLIAGAGGVIDPDTAKRLGISERGVKERKAAPEVVHSTAADAKPAEAEAPARRATEEDKDEEHGSVTLRRKRE